MIRRLDRTIESRIVAAAAELILARRQKALAVLKRKTFTVSCTERGADGADGAPCFRQVVGPEGDTMPERDFCPACLEGRKAYLEALAAGRRAGSALRSLDILVAQVVEDLPKVPNRKAQAEQIRTAAAKANKEWRNEA